MIHKALNLSIDTTLRKIQWAHLGSNQEPWPYKDPAPPLSYAPFLFKANVSR